MPRGYLFSIGAPKAGTSTLAARASAWEMAARIAAPTIPRLAGHGLDPAVSVPHACACVFP